MFYLLGGQGGQLRGDSLDAIVTDETDGAEEATESFLEGTQDLVPAFPGVNEVVEVGDNVREIHV